MMDSTLKVFATGFQSGNRSEKALLPSIHRRFLAGVVIFDDPETPRDGWACIAGANPQRIGSPYILNRDVVWLSNVPLMANVPLPPQIRHNDYLKLPFEEFLSEVGIPGHPPETSVPAAASIFGNTLGFLEAGLAANQDEILRENYLYKDVAALKPWPASITDNLLRKIQSSLWDPSVKVYDPSSPRVLTFRRPRLSFARDLLEAHIPGASDELRPVDASDLNRVVRETTFAPIVAEVSIESIKPETAALFGFSALGDLGQNNERKILARPEILMLERFAKLRIRRAWAGGSFTPAANALPGFLSKLIASGDALFSMSASIIADNAARGLMAPHPVGGRRRSLSWRAFWLRSLQRTMMYETALAFHANGHTPVSYGHGWIKAIAPKKDVDFFSLVMSAMRLGYFPAASEMHPKMMEPILSGKFGAAAPDGGWGAGAFQVYCALRGRADLALYADDVPILDKESKSQKIATIQRAMAGNTAKPR